MIEFLKLEMERHFQSARERVRDFFFAPASARPLALLRMGLALCLLAQAFLLRNSVFDFLSSRGILVAALNGSNEPFVPSIGWFTGFASLLHFDESFSLLTLCWIYFLFVLMFGLGYLNRLSSLVVFILHWTLTSPSYGTAYGFDLIAHVILFYFVFLPAADVWSMDLFLNGEMERSSAGARLGLRLLQLHLCLIFLNAGIAKAIHRSWWTGEALWRTISLPQYRQFNLNVLAAWPQLLMLASWVVLILQVGFAVFIWPHKTKKIWLAGIVALYLGFAWFFGLALFGALICLSTITLFGISPKPFPQPMLRDSIAEFAPTDSELRLD